MGIKLPWFRRQMRLGSMAHVTAASSAKREMAANATNVPSQGVFRTWNYEDAAPSRLASQPIQSARNSTQLPPIKRVQLQIQQSGPSSSTSQRPQSGASTSQQKPKDKKEVLRSSLTRSQNKQERQNKSKSMPLPSTEIPEVPQDNTKSIPEQKVETPPPQYTETPPPVKTKSKSLFGSKKAKKKATPTRRNPNAPDFKPVATTTPLNKQSKTKQNKPLEPQLSSDNISHEAINRQLSFPAATKTPESSKASDTSKQNVKSPPKQKANELSDTSHSAVFQKVNIPAITKRAEAAKKAKQNVKSNSKSSHEIPQQAKVNGQMPQSPKPTKKAPAKLKNKDSGIKKGDFPVKVQPVTAAKAQADFEETGVLSFKVDDGIIQSTSSFLQIGTQDSDECDA